MTRRMPALSPISAWFRIVHRRFALVAIAALTALSVCGSYRAYAAQADAANAAPALTTAQIDEKLRSCLFCHGPGGRVTSPEFPALAGQQKAYLITQLTAFRDKTRRDSPGASAAMAPMAAGLSDATIERLSAYFAEQTAVPGTEQNAAQTIAGRAIYEHGVPGKAVPCIACHGASAEGAGVVPRLAGLDRSYLLRQIGLFATNIRVNGSMHAETMRLTGQESDAVAAYVADAPATGSPASGLTVETCSGCHDFSGKDAPDAFVFPRLAGQQKEYLVAQLKAFRDKSRAGPRARTYMWPVAAGLDDAAIARFATYYSAQPPPPGSRQDPARVAAGKVIFENGIPDKALPCMACHGAGAQGAGSIPRLAGQHRLVLERQLGYFASNTRVNASMHQESMHLTNERERGDIAAYLAAQSPALPEAEEQTAAMVKVCSACHEFGDKNAPADFVFPRLAGQQKDYLVAQLKAFRDKSRADPRAQAYMWTVAAGLDNAAIERVASYYARQAPVPGSDQDPAHAAAGKVLYEAGIADKVLPCMACHGADAQGAGSVPRLAGQPALEIDRQLGYFAANARPNAPMHWEASHLTAAESRDVAAYVAGRSFGTPAQDGQPVAAMVRMCAACHEFSGKDAPADFVFPRLAGQQKDYLVAQLQAFRDKSRADPLARAYMWSVAAGLDDAAIEGVASYFAAQAPLPGSGRNAADIAAGRVLFEQGIPDKIPPCMACHLANAEGAGPTPRLAGQLLPVLERQLGYFAANLRANDMMHQEAKDLTPHQIGVLSAWLAAQ